MFLMWRGTPCLCAFLLIVLFVYSSLFSFLFSSFSFLDLCRFFLGACRRFTCQVNRNLLNWLLYWLIFFSSRSFWRWFGRFCCVWFVFTFRFARFCSFSSSSFSWVHVGLVHFTGREFLDSLMCAIRFYFLSFIIGRPLYCALLPLFVCLLFLSSLLFVFPFLLAIRLISRGAFFHVLSFLSCFLLLFKTFSFLLLCGSFLGTYSGLLALSIFKF